MSINRTLVPPINPVKHVSLLQPEAATLDNGVKVFVISGLEQPVIRIEFVFPFGSAASLKPLVAGMTFSMLTEGTISMDSAKLNETLDFYGSYVQNDVKRDFATFTFFGLSEHLERTLKLLKEMLHHSVFPEDELEIHLKNGKQRLEVSLEKVSTLAQRDFLNRLYPDHVYGRSAKPDDYAQVHRDDLFRFYDHIRSGSYAIVVSGHVPADMVNMLNKEFGDTESLQKKTPETPASPANISGIHHVVKEGALQSGIALGKSGFYRSQDDFADIQFTNCLFGGYFGSRLMSNIREDKGYTYGIGSSVRPLVKGGYWGISTEVGAEYTRNTLDEIRKEMELLKNEPVENLELELVRNYLVGSFVRNSDGPFAMADRFVMLHLNGLDYSYYNKYLERIGQITAEDVRHCAQRYLDFDTFTVSVAGSVDPTKAT